MRFKRKEESLFDAGEILEEYLKFNFEYCWTRCSPLRKTNKRKQTHDTFDITMERRFHRLVKILLWIEAKSFRNLCT